MEGPLLKLTVQKGPAQGGIIESKPGSKSIRIGRVVRGNTFSIKDPGISSKHLLVEFKDAKWLLSDLGASNGTFLNGNQIEANTGVGLKDGDLIKIGELTSIEVSIKEEEVELKPKQRRGRSTKAEKVAAVEPPASVGEIDKGVDLESGVGRPRRNLRRGAKAKEEQQQVLPPVIENVDSFPEKRGRRGTKNSKNVRFADVLEVGSSEENEVAKRSQVEPAHVEQEEVLPPKKLNVDSVVEKRGRKGTKNSKNVQSVDVLEVDGSEENEVAKRSQVEPSHVEQEEVLPPKKLNVDSVVGKRGRKGTKNSKSVRCEDLSVGVSAMGIVEDSQGEPSQRCGINEASKKAEKIASMKMTLDHLEKMKLGEWFDFMEVYLVKKIHEETDEIISGMQARAEQFEKFMSEQERLKNKSPLF